MTFCHFASNLTRGRKVMGCHGDGCGGLSIPCQERAGGIARFPWLWCGGNEDRLVPGRTPDGRGREVKVGAGATLCRLRVAAVASHSCDRGARGQKRVNVDLVIVSRPECRYLIDGMRQQPEPGRRPFGWSTPPLSRSRSIRRGGRRCRTSHGV